MKNDVLIRCRKERHLSQKQLAKDLGISKDYVYMLENNKRRPGIRVAKVIADYFHTTIEELFLHDNCIVADGLEDRDDRGFKSP